jgi:hypothetical protein
MLLVFGKLRELPAIMEHPCPLYTLKHYLLTEALSCLLPRNGRRAGVKPIARAPARLRHPHSSQSVAAEQDTPNGQPEKQASSKRGGAGKARKSQVDLLKTLAVEWRGENGVERLENRLGKPLEDMTRAVVPNVISIVISGVSSGPP